ncbi:MAG TPA: hypothetical protein VE153_09745 [Myxococcus sp.]|nr:hypothetical protein [Myxococcus sp.]
MSLKRGWAVLLLALLGTGCAAGRVVHLDTGQGPARIHPPREDASPVTLEGEAFRSAVRELARGTRVSGAPREVTLELLGLRDARAYSQVRGRLGLVSVEAPGGGRLLVAKGLEEDTGLVGDYGRWCQRKRLV